MSRSTREILAEIEHFSPEGDNWLRLETLLGELWEDGDPRMGIDVLLGVFERFPEHDGYGVFWSIVHGLESLGGFETKLIESVRRMPTEFSLQLVNRLVRSGVEEHDGTSLVSLLREVAGNERYSEDARDWASSFCDEHGS